MGESEEEVLRSLRRIIRRVSGYSRALARQTGLTVVQLLCLKVIQGMDPGPATVLSVAEEVQLSRSTASTVIEKLVRLGLVDRERSQIDRRKVWLRLTPTGVERLSGLPAPLQDTFLARFGRLPAEERDRIVHVLGRIVAMMDAEDLDAAPILVEGVDVQQRGSQSEPST